MVPLARAFSVFLSLANIAEEHHRSRRRRVLSLGKNAVPQPGSCDEALGRLVAGGADPETLHDTVAGLGIELVLTAHPTQSLRRTILQKHARIARGLTLLDRSSLTPVEREGVRESLAAEVQSIWLTDGLRRRKPTPLDEARSGLVVVEHALWDAIPRFHRELDRALGKLRSELSMGDATDELRSTVAAGAREPYRELLREVRDRFVATRAWCEKRLSEVRAGAEPVETFEAARDEGLGPIYLDPREVADALDLCDRSLRATGAGRVADGRLLDIRRRLSVLGLTLMSLDVRHDSGAHTNAMDALTRALGLGSYAAWDEKTRQEFLLRELESPRRLSPREMPDDGDLANVMATLRVCALQGPGSLGAYVISMATAASDVLAVELLQREAGIEPPLRVVPLFETLADLDGAADVVAELLDMPTQRARIGDRMEVMIGYSDSAKDAGRLGAAWALYRAQEAIAQATTTRGVALTLFHGRGGTVGRGGGPTWLAITSQPTGSVRGTLRVTEQGEMIDHKFGLAELALRNMEVYTTATLEATLSDAIEPKPSWSEAMEALTTAATAAYRAMVRDEPNFVPYFRAATPERELGWLNIGSRPARRRGGTGVESLRAIPWVFAWNQNRLILPAWLGVGEALQSAIAAGHEDTLVEMARDWPFFRSTLELIEMVLAKAMPDIAALYDELLVPEALRPLGVTLRERLTLRGSI